MANTLMTRSAIDLAAMVRNGDVTSRELVEDALSRIEARKELNAFTFVDAERALKTAGAIGKGDARPFAGVPIAIKELNAVEGMPQTMGSDLFGDFSPGYDDYFVRRLRNAGFVIIGRTTSPEFGIVPVTESRRFGPTRNPWNLNHTTGGSSGGAGAAVAGGILPVAHASDGGGSIRIPAACCGLVGLKPSRGRISTGPAAGDNFLATNGVLTRSVAESAALLDVLAGYEVGDATWTPPPAEPFANAVRRPPGRLRIKFSTESPIDTPVEPLHVKAVHDAAKLLESLGHEVDELDASDLRAPETEPLFGVLYAAGIGSGVQWGGNVAGREPKPGDVEALTWGFYEMGKAISSIDLLAAIAELQRMGRKIVNYFTTFDLLITPTIGQRPLPIGTIDVESPDWITEFRKAAVFAPFTAGWNITGQPAISLPLYHGDDGLPLAVQIIAPPIREDLLISIASQLEQAAPWSNRRAPGV